MNRRKPNNIMDTGVTTIILTPSFYTHTVYCTHINYDQLPSKVV